ncbi:transglutaminase-like cysteine peptidase [Novosphingobium tardum]|uniref:Transglutaminase-like cysteine peptidase n=1 Tax=Novosphingobium tardum TaxID=1538021 RepID=A0ABV8RQI0_9SPHN
MRAGHLSGFVAAALAIIACGASTAALGQAPGAPPSVTDPSLPQPAPLVCPAPAAAVVMPTSGLTFTLPPDPADPNALACAPSEPPPPVRPPAPSLFHMMALPIGYSPALRKWEHARESSLAGHPGPWEELVAQANRVTGGNPIGMVNQWVNWHVRYRNDPSDEWASAATTLARGYGDCEDFALAKMALLGALGIPADSMYLVLLHDRQGDQHAVLVVSREGRRYVLDNRTDRLLTAEQVDDYTPILSFSGSFAWTYGKPMR